MTTTGSREALDRSMASAVAWNAAARWTAQIFSWISTIIVARLLTPRDYGIMGMVALYLSLATLVSEAGIADAVVMFRDLTHRQIAQLNTSAMIMGAGLAALSCGLAFPLARFFSTPQLRAVVMVMSIQCVIGGLQVVPRALLQKDLKFKRLASADTIRAFSQIAATVALASLGFAYWSLVWGQVLAVAVSAGLMLYWRRHSFAWPHLGELHRELQFSTHLLLSRVAWYTYENADFLVAGRVLGQVPLGNYTIAWTISSAPVDKVSSLVGGIAPAYFSAVQKDCVELRRYLLRMTEALSYVTVPASIGLALVADYLVPALLGPKWIGVIGPLRLLSLYIAVRSISTLLPHILNATGDSRFAMHVKMVSAVVMPLAFFIGSHWGTQGIAAAWVVMYPPITIPLCYRIFRRIGLTMREYFSSVAPSLAASAIMTALILLTRWMLPATMPLIARLLLVVAVGTLAYVGALFCFFRHRLRWLLRAISSMRDRGQHTQESTETCSAPEDKTAVNFLVEEETTGTQSDKPRG